MTFDQSYIHRKEVDWSLLHEGLTIPVHLQVSFRTLLNGYERGVGRRITLLVEGQPFDAMLINQAFDREKYARHSDVVQIRFTAKSGLPQRLRQIFPSSYAYLKQERELLKGKKTFVRLPEGSREYFVLYTTQRPDVFTVEVITKSELYEANTLLAGLSEEEFERFGDFARRDDSASILTRPQLAKVRKLDRSIGEDLKILYDYRCQICGDNFGEPYEQRIVEVHHVIQFVRSMNNDYDNLMVICPNHHTVIHKTNPIFDRQALKLAYPNGYHENLKLDKHLRMCSI
ncbi:HNH endonuclease signature motif containing protein [Geobacter sp.]|uniref:HNH endonuclease signature motif containing protein n=1 Tax=Geobacter sp. TaxID=46610 RepID=UPI002627ABE1|nr:HNH endonuclease signature motif containing protein [Geobacter sp.]